MGDLESNWDYSSPKLILFSGAPAPTATPLPPIPVVLLSLRGNPKFTGSETCSDYL